MRLKGAYKKGQKESNKNKTKKEAKRAQQQTNKREKMREKGEMSLSFPHLCFKVAACFSYRESPMLLF